MESPPVQPVVAPARETATAHAQKNACHETGKHATSASVASGGGVRPVPVTRGESADAEPGARGELALIDWLGFTAHSGKPDDWQWMRSVLHHVFGIPADSWKGTNRQWHGYKHLVQLIHPSDRGERLMLGQLAWGGEHQRGTVHVDLNGQACAHLVQWDEIQSWGESTGSTITRVDAAHDDLSGATVNIAQARAWYAAGGFDANGRPPQAELIDDLDSGKGKTFYIGNRAYGKLCRVYEKGKKEGDPANPWCRVEVEWRNKSREIPWDILSRPADYLAGAYPCLAYLSERQERIKTVRHAAAIQYPRMVAWLKSSAGKALNVMHQVEGGNAEAVLMQVIREGTPKRLEPFTSWPGMLKEVAHADADPE